MATHYDVLGVRPDASTAAIRAAFVGKARALHPDGHGGRPDAELDAVRRAMQDVNEAWRVLRDPLLRSAYDRLLQEAPTQAEARVGHPAAAPAESDLDRPYPRRPAEPGDVTVAFVRAAPWVALVAVLVAIFVFTAVARNDGTEDGDTLIGKCVITSNGPAEEVPCSAPNDGEVVDVVRASSGCTGGAVAKVVPGGTWYCLRPAEE